MVQYTGRGYYTFVGTSAVQMQVIILPEDGGVEHVTPSDVMSRHTHKAQNTHIQAHLSLLSRTETQTHFCIGTREHEQTQTLRMHRRQTRVAAVHLRQRKRRARERK